MAAVRVNVRGGYDVRIGRGLLDDCGASVRAALPGTGLAAVVTDSNVAPLYLDRCAKSLGDAGLEVRPFVVPAGEGSKNLAELSELLEFLASSGLTRADGVVALGGGVVGDLAGFAAGCCLRGVRFVQIPTTLLAAVDSSVGGKTAVDLKAGKNLAGLFHQPSLVLCDTACLDTLPEAEWLCGMAEALKTGVLSGEELFRRFEDGTARGDIDGVIARCVGYKAGVVERDETERGERKLLNLGHTVAHSVELLSGYGVPHGLAVAAGLAVIARASAKRGWCSKETARRVEAALLRNGLPVASPYSPDELAVAALSDKKRRGDSITLVLPAEIGACALREVSVDELRDVIADGMKRDGEAGR